jgi:hypothetical protein
MESIKQEKIDLLKDNPIARDASGDRPWITKHYRSTMGSPIKSGHADSPVEGNAFTKAMSDAGGDYDKAKSMLEMNYDSAAAMYDAPTAKKKCHHNR